MGDVRMSPAHEIAIASFLLSNNMCNKIVFTRIALAYMKISSFRFRDQAGHRLTDVVRVLQVSANTQGIISVIT